MNNCDVYVPSYLMDLIPEYLRRLKEDVRQMKECVGYDDYDQIYKLSHKISGNAASYGFEEVGELCIEITDMYFEKNTKVIVTNIEKLNERILHYRIVEVKESA